jgi:hypothetical protein
MQSTNGANRYASMKEIASAARRRAGVRATRKAAMRGGAGTAVLVLLFLTSVWYVVFGGNYEVAASPEAGTSVAAAARPAAAGGAPRSGNVSSNYATPSEEIFFPAAYANRGRDGDGNVMTYEHD